MVEGAALRPRHPGLTRATASGASSRGVSTCATALRARPRGVGSGGPITSAWPGPASSSASPRDTRGSFAACEPLPVLPFDDEAEDTSLPCDLHPAPRAAPCAPGTCGARRGRATPGVRACGATTPACTYAPRTGTDDAARVLHHHDHDPRPPRGPGPRPPSSAAPALPLHPSQPSAGVPRRPTPGHRRRASTLPTARTPRYPPGFSPRSAGTSPTSDAPAPRAVLGLAARRIAPHRGPHRRRARPRPRLAGLTGSTVGAIARFRGGARLVATGPPRRPRGSTRRAPVPLTGKPLPSIGTAILDWYRPRYYKRHRRSMDYEEFVSRKASPREHRRASRRRSRRTRRCFHSSTTSCRRCGEGAAPSLPTPASVRPACSLRGGDAVRRHTARKVFVICAGSPWPSRPPPKGATWA